jgi:parallel beta-helix repeat protein
MKKTRTLTIIFSIIGQSLASASYALPPMDTPLNFIATNSTKCLDVRAPKNSPNSAVVQMSCNTDPSQTWKFTSVGTNQFQITSPSNGLCFDLSGASKINGGLLKQATCVAGKPNQTWALKETTPGFFEIISINSQKCLDVTNASSADNIQIQQWDCGGEANQTWRFQLITKPSPPIVINNQSNVTIANVKITNPAGPCILITGNSKNIVVQNSELGPCLTDMNNPKPDLSNVGAGVFVTGSNNVTVNNVNIHDTDDAGVTIFYGNNFTVSNNQFARTKSQAIKGQALANMAITHNNAQNVESGVYVAGATGVTVSYNNFAHIQGNPRANFIQFNTVTGGSNSIMCNVGIQDAYGTAASLDSIEDDISLYHSSGTAASPILVIGNKVKNGGPSKTGGGIMLGDDGGAYITAIDNVVVTPGGYGMAVSGGTNMIMQNNLIYSGYTPIVNNGIAVWNYNPSTVTCDNITVSGNRVNWTNTWGPDTTIWENNTCSNAHFTKNTFQDSSVTAAIFDTYNPSECKA